MTTQYGDISPRTAAYAAAKLLDRALPALCLGRFGQQQPIPKNKSQTVRWRRYNGFAPSTVPLVEGVTPAPDLITYTDYEATLKQYGRRVQVSDVIIDTHEDPVLNEYAEIMGEVAGQTQEVIVFNAIKGGTNVLWAGGTSRATVAQALTGSNGATVLGRAIRTLRRQNAKPVTRMLAGTDKVGTAPIRPGYVAFCHPDLQQDLEGITGWKNPVEYGTYQPLMPSEIGSYKEIRFLASTLFTPWLTAATTTGSGSTFMTGGSTGTGVPDVYPVIIIGMDAFATVSLAGANAVTPIVLNPKPSDSDVMAQRGHVAFKMWSTAAILNDAWLLRVEALVTQ
jgi:N4-gp56 family major capsid protein